MGGWGERERERAGKQRRRLRQDERVSWWVVTVWSGRRIGKLPLLQWRGRREGGEARLHAMSAQQALWQKRAGASNKKCKAEGVEQGKRFV